MPNTKTTTIELNGKLYDALTGRAINGAPATAAKPAKSVAPVKPTNSRTSKASVDGIYRPASTKPRTARSQIPAKRHAPQKANTLMRNVVSKPKIAPAAAQAKTSKPTKSAAQAAATTGTRLESTDGRLQKRLEHAAKVPKSTAVRRFSFASADRQPVNKRVEPLAVQPHPAQAAPSKSASAQAARQAVAKATTGQSRTSQAAKVFDKELRAASSHRQTPLAKKRKLKTSTKLATAAVAVAFIGGFLAHHNLPTLSLKLADAKAGFQASLPNYTPDGFALNRSVQAAPGEIILAFRSNSDSRSYKVTQRLSDWSSSDLLNNFVKPTYGQYQTIQSAGKTVYLDSSKDSNATWVSNGIWYQIKGDSKLSSQQLVKIINSL